MMNPHDPRSHSVMGYPHYNAYPPNGQRLGPPQPPQPAYPMPYHGANAYASPYQPYPTPTANPKDYSSDQSFNMWYASDKYGQWSPESSNSKKFARLLFATMITLVISLCMVSLVVWLLFGTDVPDFQLTHFTVSNLTLAGPMIEANWCVNMTATNPNPELKLNAGTIKASVLYKDFPLAMTTVDPIYTQANTEGVGNQINMFFVMEHQKSICRTDLIRDLLNEEKAGNLILSLRLAVGTRFSSHGEWRHDSLRIFCEDIKLNMDKGLGGITDDSPRGCLIFA